AVAVRQAEVEKDEIGMPCGALRRTVASAGGFVKTIVFRHHHGAQELSNLRIILDEQNFGSLDQRWPPAVRHLSFPSGARPGSGLIGSVKRIIAPPLW